VVVAVVLTTTQEALQPAVEVLVLILPALLVQQDHLTPVAVEAVAEQAAHLASHQTAAQAARESSFSNSPTHTPSQSVVALLDQQLDQAVATTSPQSRQAQET